MAVTREHLGQGLSYIEFKDKMTRNRERIEANERRLELSSADLAPFKKLSKPMDVLVLAEDWCGDVIDNLPIIARIAAESGKLNVKILLRDQNLDVMDQYLKQGQYRSIPVFSFLDDSLQEIGRFTERPDSVTERRAQRRQAIYDQNPEFGSPDAPVDQLPEDVRARLTQAIATMREELKPTENRDVVRSLAEIVGRAS